MFGQASSFQGFAGFAAANAGTSPFGQAPPAAVAAGGEKEAEAGGAAAAAAEEECQAEFEPLVQLDKVEVKSGEEEEEALLAYKAKLYRYDTAGSEWKERGIGQCRILKHKESGRIRLLMRQDKTLKLCANHLIMPGTELKNHEGNEKAWVWSAPDYAEEEMKTEVFCIRFGNVERATEFKEKFMEAQAVNEKLIEEADDGEEEAAEEEAKPSAEDELAGALEAAKVEDAPDKEEGA